MEIGYANKKNLMPSIGIEDKDIPLAAELNLTLKTNGWKVYAEMYKETREDMINSIKSAVMLKDNDREIAVKSAILLGFDACFGMANAFISDAEEYVKTNIEKMEEENEDE